MNRRDATVLRIFGLWTVYVWATRLWNIWRDDARDVPFKVVHTVLAVISVVLAGMCLQIVRRNRRPAADVDSSTEVLSGR
jgi:TRAP-type C4-dicarboxylate transport system permease small subunit